MMETALGVIGAGSMGSAIVQGALARGILDAAVVMIVEPDARRRKIMEDLGCRVEKKAKDVLAADQVLLAVKPQHFASVAREIAPLERETIIISIMAGVSSAIIRAALGPAARIIRAMPNTPARIGAGITAIARGEGARPGDELFARDLFNAVGEVIEVDESLMHAVTALSGSGPAYVFLLAEAMEQAGAQMGLEPGAARALAYETIHGSGRLLHERGEETADSLRTAVTSPGGTTAAALEVLFEKELPQLIADAIIAARDRSEELAEEAEA